MRIVKFIRFLFCAGIILFVLPTCNFLQEEISIKEYFITCSPEDFADRYTNYKENIYIPITITHNGVTLTGARMRFRGDTSRELPKKSLKVRFDSKIFVNHRNVLNFNAEYTDKSYIRQYLASRLMGEAGQDCFNAEFARLYINGKFSGLYLLVENMDEDFLIARGLDPTGNLYKATNDGACMSIFDDVNNHWEKKAGVGGREDLSNLIEKINSVPDNEYYDFMREYFEYEKIVNMIALNMITANGSTYYHNYYMYHDINNTGRWQMFPWDMDKTMSYYDWMPYSHNRTSSPWESDNPLVERAVICKPVMNDIKQRIDELSKTIFTEEHIFPIIDELRGLLEESVKEDTSDNITGVDAWFKTLEKEKLFIKNHYANLQHQFNNWPESFRVNIINDIITDKVRFIWHPSESPREKKITYNLHYSKNFLLEDSLTTVIENIADTTYLLSAALEEGNYYWKVVATDGEYFIDGFNTKNIFQVKKATLLPCQVKDDLVLNKSGSPYVLDCEMNVKPGASLIIEKGVELRMKEGVNIYVKGTMQIFGTKEEPVRLRPDLEVDSWGWIYLDHPTGDCIFSNVSFEEGILNAKYANLTIDSANFFIDKKQIAWGWEKRYAIIWVHHGNFILKNSTMVSNGTGEGINVNFASALVENSSFFNTPDAIEFIDVNDGIIRGNRVEGSPDDAIDLNGCNDVLITGNVLINNADKGISIGTEQYGASRNIIIEKNLIIGNNVGIAVKDSSNAFIYNNTLFDNNVSISCYKKREGYKLGGRANIKNTIIAKSRTSAVTADKLSSVTISYSLCDTEKLPGKGNIKSAPKFNSPRDNDFHLQPGSPCIKAGDPKNLLNKDGTRGDIGAF